MLEMSRSVVWSQDTSSSSLAHHDLICINIASIFAAICHLDIFELLLEACQLHQVGRFELSHLPCNLGPECSVLILPFLTCGIFQLLAILLGKQRFNLTKLCLQTSQVISIAILAAVCGLDISELLLQAGQ